MEWHRVAWEDVDIGSIIRWEHPRLGILYAMPLAEGMFIDLDAPCMYEVHNISELKDIPDFIEVLTISDDNTRLPSESILVLAQILIKNSTGDTND